MTPFYEDWKFWSVIVSTIAIILSQLPPLHILLRRAKLEIEAYSNIHLAHKIGNPNVQMYLIISNSGGRELKIKGMKLRLQRGTEDEFVLSAKGYLQNRSDKDNVLLTTFRLKPKEEWGHFVNFFNSFPRHDEKTYRQLETNLKQNILVKLQRLENKNVDVPGEDENVQPLIKFFERYFRWEPGEYTLTVEVEVDPEGAKLSKQQQFPELWPLWEGSPEFAKS